MSLVLKGFKEIKWDIVDLPDLVFFQEGPGVRKNQYTEEGVKLLNVSNLQKGKIDLTTSDRYISEEEAYGRYEHFLVDEGDLIIASSGIKVDYFDEKMGFITKEHLPLCMNTSTIRFKSLDEDVLNIRYFMYFLKTNYFKKQLQRLITGSAQLNFGPSHLKQIKVILPEINIQNQIVDILDTTQNMIDKRQQQIEALSDLKQSIFLKMFGTVKTNKYNFKKSRLGEFTLLVTSGSTPRGGRKSYLNEGIPLIRSQNVLWNELRLEDVVFISEETHNNMKRSQLINRDVLLNITGASIGRSVVYEGSDYEANVNQHVCIIRLNESINPYYLSYYFTNDEFQKNVVNKNIGATRQAFNYTQIKNFDILVPDISLQNDFEDKVKEIDKRIDLLYKSIGRFNMLYHSVLHKAFNGELFKEDVKVV